MKVSCLLLALLIPLSSSSHYHSRKSWLPVKYETLPSGHIDKTSPTQDCVTPYKEIDIDKCTRRCYDMSKYSHLVCML